MKHALRSSGPINCGHAKFVKSHGAVPVVKTERLRLRGHRVEDFADSAAMWGDSIVARYVGGKPLSEEETWTKLLRYVEHWARLGFGYWVVEDKSSGKFVGEVGFANYKRDTQQSLGGMPEAGWVLAPGSARDGLCHGSGSRGYGLGRGALRSYPHGLHHSSGKCRVDSRGGEVWVS